MSARTSRNLLIAAFAISLLLHTLLALNLHPRRSEGPADVEVVSIERRATVIRAVKTPPPRPRQTHTPAPAESPAPKPTSSGSKPSGSGGPGAPTAAPTPVPTPAATSVAHNPCGRDDADAAVKTEPTPPVIPVSARADGTSGTTIVKVQLDVAGAVTGTAVTQTSGSQALDAIAMGMARDAEYSPALHDCKPVATAYEFSVRFAAW
jgi:TonB family protein